ncbi:MAG: L-aspartate oxidase [Planctomycetota bacterium]
MKVDDRRYLIPFRATLLPQIFTDVLVIGAGVAGMRAALGMGADGEGLDVIVAAKGTLKQSNTHWAQGGMAAAVAEGDDPEQHAADTLKAGAGLCDADVVARVVEGGATAAAELAGWEMPFDRTPEAGEHQTHEAAGALAGVALGREGGHGRFRILHSDGDATGKALTATLGRQIAQAANIRLFTDCFVLDLITGDGGSPRVLGAITHHPRYGLQVIWASATVLAAGGAGQVYRESTNPNVATGDGIAMAWRAGAALQDLAFMQFHPTTLYVAGASRALITEAVRGEGAQLIDRDGHRFMPDYDERAELAPRDVVSRCILKQLAKTGGTHVYLDTRSLGADRFRTRFPGIGKMLDEFEIDPGGSIPVHPSAHYMIGGVRVDADGRTNLPGLWACGEVSCSGLNGANRLASNSLLEGMVLGKAVADDVRRCVGGNGGPQRVKVVSDIRLSDRSELDLADVRSSLRSVMWRHVGIEREGDRLDEVEEMFEFWSRYTLDKIFDDRHGWEVQNLLTIGTLITRAAQWRKESRGTHLRLDFSQPQEAFAVHDVWQRGRSSCETVPVSG